jgi:hypothetical protein
MIDISNLSSLHSFSYQPTDQPTNQSTDQPTDQPTNQPTIQPTNQPNRQPTNQPNSQPTNQPNRQPTNQPTKPPTNQPTKPPTNQPTKPPNNQTANQPTNQTAKQPNRQPNRATINQTNAMAQSKQIESSIGKMQSCIGQTTRLKKSLLYCAMMTFGVAIGRMSEAFSNPNARNILDTDDADTQISTMTNVMNSMRLEPKTIQMSDKYQSFDPNSAITETTVIILDKNGYQIFNGKIAPQNRDAAQATIRGHASYATVGEPKVIQFPFNDPKYPIVTMTWERKQGGMRRLI